MMEIDDQIPSEVQQVSDSLQNAGFEVYLVGGCTRDILLGRKPSDWDIATNATPDKVQALFEHTFYENDFGTVGIVFDTPSDPTLEVVEVTTYRTEHSYTDNRRPDSVSFSKTIDEDLDRRDFTVNAIGISVPIGQSHISNGHIKDNHNGQDDIENKLIRAVGNPDDRFEEDALRMLRAVRLTTELGFEIEVSSETAIVRLAENITTISHERIRDEISRIIMSANPMRGILLAEKTALLKYILPELLECKNVEQGGVHSDDVYTHCLKSLQAVADKGWTLDLRLAALFHDIGKPKTQRRGKNKEWSFHGHEVVSAKMAKFVMKRLKYPTELTERVTKLVRWHMFFSDTEQITHSAVRRLMRNVGIENVWDLMNLRIADRIGMGRPKEQPYRFRKYKAMIEEVQRDPVSVGMLKIDGARVMEVTDETPGPRIGNLLHALLDEVLEDPSKNDPEKLENRAKELAQLSDRELATLGEKGRAQKDELEEKAVKDIRGQFGVQ